MTFSGFLRILKLWLLTTGPVGWFVLLVFDREARRFAWKEITQDNQAEPVDSRWELWERVQPEETRYSADHVSTRLERATATVVDGVANAYFLYLLIYAIGWIVSSLTGWTGYVFHWIGAGISATWFVVYLLFGKTIERQGRSYQRPPLSARLLDASCNGASIGSLVTLAVGIPALHFQWLGGMQSLLLVFGVTCTFFFFGAWLRKNHAPGNVIAVWTGRNRRERTETVLLVILHAAIGTSLAAMWTWAWTGSSLIGASLGGCGAVARTILAISASRDFLSQRVRYVPNRSLETCESHAAVRVSSWFLVADVLAVSACGFVMVAAIVWQVSRAFGIESSWWFTGGLFCAAWAGVSELHKHQSIMRAVNRSVLSRVIDGVSSGLLTSALLTVFVGIPCVYYGWFYSGASLTTMYVGTFSLVFSGGWLGADSLRSDFVEHARRSRREWVEMILLMLTEGALVWAVVGFMWARWWEANAIVIAIMVAIACISSHVAKIGWGTDRVIKLRSSRLPTLDRWVHASSSGLLLSALATNAAMFAEISQVMLLVVAIYAFILSAVCRALIAPIERAPRSHSDWRMLLSHGFGIVIVLSWPFALAGGLFWSRTVWLGMFSGAYLGLGVGLSILLRLDNCSDDTKGRTLPCRFRDGVIAACGGALAVSLVTISAAWCVGESPWAWFSVPSVAAGYLLGGLGWLVGVSKW